MKRDSLIISALLILILGTSGCVGNSNIDKILRQLPETKAFLNEHPGAEITAVLWSIEYIEANADKIEKNCSSAIDKDRSYYRVDIRENENEIIIWIDEKNSKPVCLYKKGFETESNPFDWSKATIDMFINREITPYVAPSYASGNQMNVTQASSSMTNGTHNSAMVGVTEGVVEYYNESSAMETTEMFERPPSEPTNFMTSIVRVNDEEIYETFVINRTLGQKNNMGYLWQKDRFVFSVGGVDDYRKLELVKWIVEQYTGKKVGKTENDTLYDCGNDKCERWENSNNCCVDCCS